jgi:hypothetical protein
VLQWRIDQFADLHDEAAREKNTTLLDVAAIAGAMMATRCTFSLIFTL